MSEGRKHNLAARKAVDDLLDYLIAHGWEVGAATLYVRMVALGQIDDWRERAERKREVSAG